MVEFNHKLVNLACSWRLIAIQLPLIDTKVFAKIEAMILTCPSCSASYMVPVEAIGAQGRDVRCKKCSHVWHQSPENYLSEKDTESNRKNLSDIITRIQTSGPEEDDIFFGIIKNKKQPKSLRKFLSALKSNLQSLWAPVADKLPPALFFQVKVQKIKPHFAASLTALAVFMLCFWAVVAARWSIVSSFPLTRQAFTVAGFPLAPYTNINPEEALIFDHPELHIDSKTPRISGRLINLTDSKIRFPVLSVTYYDGHGQKLVDKAYPVPSPALEKEQSVPVNLPMPLDVADKLHHVEIRFDK